MGECTIFDGRGIKLSILRGKKHLQFEIKTLNFGIKTFNFEIKTFNFEIKTFTFGIKTFNFESLLAAAHYPKAKRSSKQFNFPLEANPHQLK